MSDNFDLEFYGEIKTKSDLEGLGYYIQHYESAKTFDGDEELKQEFMKAQEGIIGFEDLLYKRIRDLGGEPEDYEA